jgi:multiple sugar transport system substrate-binding protein
VEIRVLGLTDPGITAESKLAKEFTQQTGVEVVYETYEWAGFVEKCKLEFSNPTGSYDIIEYDALMSAGLLPNDSLVPLEPFIKDPKLGDIGLAGFVGRLVGYYGTWNGKVVGFPRSSANRMYGYRRDLFEDPKEKAAFKAKYGYELKFPETWQQFRDVAQFFTRDTNKDGTIDFWGVGTPPMATPTAFSDIYRTFNAVKDGEWFLDRA